MEAENFKQQLRKTCMEFLVLRAISNGPAYAPNIIAVLQKAQITVVEGTIYPLLTRLKNSGVLCYEWQESTQGPPRKYYTLTEAGVSYLESMKKSWSELEKSMQTIENQKIEK